MNTKHTTAISTMSSLISKQGTEWTEPGQGATFGDLWDAIDALLAQRDAMAEALRQIRNWLPRQSGITERTQEDRIDEIARAALTKVTP